MLCAIVDNNTCIEVKELTEEEYLSVSYLHQIVLDITDMVPSPVKGWTFDGLKLIPPVSSDTAEYICLTVYDPMVEGFRKIKRQFIGENILWGISQLGKTRAVGDFMEPIEKWFSRVAPLETIVEIEIAKGRLLADSALANSLTPFVTIDRLNWYKTEILKVVS